MKSTRWAGVLAAVSTAALTLAGLSSPASAAVGNSLIVSQDSAGQITIQQGSVLQAGSVIQARFSSAYAQTDPEILRLLNGATLAQVDQKIAEAGQGGTVAQAAMLWFTGDRTHLTHAEFFGGLPATGSNKFDRILAPGKYYIAQMRPVGNVKPSTTAKAFNVVGSPSATFPVANQKVEVTNTSGPDQFSVYSNVMGVVHNGPITLTNKTGSITNPTRELHFFQWTQVQPGTTSAQVCSWLTAGGPSPVVPGGGTANFGTLSTQQAVNGYLSLPLGRYVILSWIPDVNTGVPHALECEFGLADLTS